jgi:hypothetical protein
MRFCLLFAASIAVVAASGCSEVSPTIPSLRDPIAIVSGGSYDDGGSVAVMLRDTERNSLSIVYSQDTFPNDNFEPNCLYVGTIDELYEGAATNCLLDSEAAIIIADYLDRALRKNDPDFAVDELANGRRLDVEEASEISAAKGLLQFLRAGIPANLVRTN